MLSKMCSMQLLESSGYGRGTKYHVYGLHIDVPKSNIGLEEPYMGFNMGTSEANMDSSRANMALNMDTSDANMDSSSSNMALDMGSSRVQKVHPRRYNKEQLRELIVEFCKEWRTADEIAVKIGRDTKYIKNFVLPQMSDLLEKLYENIPHHPRQKNRARQQDAD